MINYLFSGITGPMPKSKNNHWPLCIFQNRSCSWLSEETSDYVSISRTGKNNYIRTRSRNVGIFK
jgi:hypothetical protein